MTIQYAYKWRWIILGLVAILLLFILFTYPYPWHTAFEYDRFSISVLLFIFYLLYAFDVMFITKAQFLEEGIEIRRIRTRLVPYSEVYGIHLGSSGISIATRKGNYFVRQFWVNDYQNVKKALHADERLPKLSFWETLSWRKSLFYTALYMVILMLAIPMFSAFNYEKYNHLLPLAPIEVVEIEGTTTRKHTIALRIYKNQKDVHASLRLKNHPTYYFNYNNSGLKNQICRLTEHEERITIPENTNVRLKIRAEDYQKLMSNEPTDFYGGAPHYGVAFYSLHFSDTTFIEKYGLQTVPLPRE